MIYPGGWRREEQEMGETQELVTAAPGAPGGAPAGGPQDGWGWSRRHLISWLSGPTPNRARRASYYARCPPHTNGLPCLDSGARRISRGWCAWSTPAGQRRAVSGTHTRTHAHAFTRTRCALLRRWVAWPPVTWLPAVAALSRCCRFAHALGTHVTCQHTLRAPPRRRPQPPYAAQLRSSPVEMPLP
jgi:hypothetical protein